MDSGSQWDQLCLACRSNPPKPGSKHDSFGNPFGPIICVNSDTGPKDRTEMVNTFEMEVCDG